MQKTKLLLSILSVICVLSLLASCGNSSDNPGESETIPVNYVTLIEEDGTTEYTLVRPDDMNMYPQTVQMTVDLLALIKERTGKNIPITTDFDGRNDYSNRAEILIGATNRALSQRLMEGLDRFGYRIVLEGNKLAIVGGSEAALHEGLEYFKSTYMSSDFTGLKVPENLDYTGQATGDIDRPTVAKTVYPTQDLIVADVVATDGIYGADSSGAIDSTNAIIRALADCSKNGGGTVYLPAGHYKVSSTITIPSQVTLRGDRRDPDEGSGDYGTVIVANVSKNIGTLFLMDQNSGARGLTAYYPNQSIESPKDLGWTFEFRADGPQGPAIGDITLLNSYKGIGLSVDDYKAKANSNMYLFNIRGCVLSKGLEVYNNAGACSYENIYFDGKYWVEAGAEYNAPSQSAVDAYTRKNLKAFIMGDLDMPLIHDIGARSCQTGFCTVEGPRSIFWGAGMSKLNFTDCDYAMQIDVHSDKRMSGLTESTLKGSEAALIMTEQAYLYLADCNIEGEVIGYTINFEDELTQIKDYVDNPGTYQAAKATLYDVTKAPYSAPYAPVNQTGNLGQDCTSAIQNALNDAGAAGGGIVYLPAGHYRILGHLTVPAGVELRGAGSIPNAPGPAGGTTLFIYADQGTSNPLHETAAVTLEGDGAGLRYLTFFYPENPFVEADSLVMYPYAVRLENAKNAYVFDVLFANPCYGIDITEGSDNHYIKRVTGTFALNMIQVGKTIGGWIETLHDINPGYWTIAGRYGISTPWMTDIFDHFHDYQMDHSDLIIVDGATDEHILDLLQYGARYLITVKDGDVQIVNALNDQGGSSCLYVLGGKVLAVNTELTGRSNDQINIVRSGDVKIYNAFNIAA